MSARRRPTPLDVLIAAAVALVQLAGTTMATRHGHGVVGRVQLDALGYALLAAGPVALLWRSRFPRPVLLFTFAVTLTYIFLGYTYGPVFASLVVAFLTAASAGSRVLPYVVLVTGYVAIVAIAPVVTDHGLGAAAAGGVAAWLLVLAAVAEVIRQRRATITARRQRAGERERARAAERDRQASDERLSIARELHDVLGHSLSLINVQSGVALELFDADPEQARGALAAIKTVSKDALTEVHDVLDALRSRPATAPGADSPPRAPRTPAASIADPDALVAKARDAGLTVDVQVEGALIPLPSRVDLAASRIVQESVTNVLRHAAGAPARVIVRYGPHAVELDITDSGTGRAAGPGTAAEGNGITGMRERAHALGGRLRAGPEPGGGFGVHANLPFTTDREVST